MSAICELCFHHCKLDEGQTSLCRARTCRDGAVIPLNYGKLTSLDLDVLGYIDHNITVNIIQDNRIVEKKTLKLPKKITNVIHCKNPRCITSIEQELPDVFCLSDEKTETYRCLYCEEKYGK